MFNMEDANFILYVVDKCLYSAERVSEDYLLTNIAGKLIKNTFASIAEELAINERCGYIRCQNSISDQHLNQRYKIAKNCLYDLTERKKFCSDACYTWYGQVLDQLDDVAMPERIVHFPDVATVENKSKKPALKPGEKMEFNDAAEIAKSLERLRIADQPENSYEIDTIKPENAQGGVEATEHLHNIASSSHLIEDETFIALDDGNFDPEEETRDVDVNTAVPRCQIKIQKHDLNYSLARVRQKYFDGSSKAGLTLKKKQIPIIEPLPLKNVGNVEKLGQVPKESKKVLKMDNLKRVLLEWTSEKNAEESVTSRDEDNLAFKLQVEAFFKGDLGQLRPKNENGTDFENEPQRNYTSPIVDSVNQMRLRRRIVFNKLRIVLPSVSEVLRLKLEDTLKIIKNTMPVLQFTASNINLSTNEWMVCCLILLTRFGPVDFQQNRKQVDTFLSQLTCDLSDFYELCSCVNIK